MSDMGLEAPDADSAEQSQGAIPEPAEDLAPAGEPELPLEASEADSAEQDQLAGPDDDEYR